MDYKISNELLEEIIGIDLRELEVSIDNGIIKIFNYDTKICDYVIKHQESINDFLFKCKEWAVNHKFIITPIVIISGKNYLKYVLEVRSFYNPSIDREAFDYFRKGNPKIYNSEQHAIIDACEYIRKIVKKH